MKVNLALVLVLAAAGTAWAATPFDGIYKGGNTLAGGGGQRCPAAQSFTIRVQNGVFGWKPAASDAEQIQVGPDGSFHGRSGQRFIDGQITGTTMTASTSGGACNYTWSLTK